MNNMALAEWWTALAPAVFSRVTLIRCEGRRSIATRKMVCIQKRILPNCNEMNRVSVDLAYAKMLIDVRQPTVTKPSVPIYGCRVDGLMCLAFIISMSSRRRIDRWIIWHAWMLIRCLVRVSYDLQT